MTRLAQIQHPTQGRRVAQVEADRLRLLREYASVHSCALAAVENKTTLATQVESSLSADTLDYDALYAGQSEWRLLPPFDHPDEPARCLVSGTGLTHRKSADNRNAMHQTDTLPAPPVTDSMKIYRWGVEDGRPEPGSIGVQPEWFYKGSGGILRAHGEPLDVPDFADDGGEEAEIAGLYVIDGQGAPWRIGFAQGNEFSDHVMEAKNYLYLAPSKLRACALGPELVVGGAFGSEPRDGGDFDDLRGTVTIERAGQPLWTQPLASGNANMVHTLANLEHHHFKYAEHRRPGDAHVHFFGAGGFSFGAGVTLADGDIMTVAFDACGRPLRNPLRIANLPPLRREVRAL